MIHPEAVNKYASKEVNMKKIYLSILIIFLSIFFNNIALCKTSNVHFACKLVMKNQSVFQTLVLGYDWKEITNYLKLKQQQQSFVTFDVSKLCYYDDYISFQLQGCDSDYNLEILLYNLEGRKIYNTTILAPQSKIKYDIFIPGLKYSILFCSFINADKYIVKKIINEK